MKDNKNNSIYYQYKTKEEDVNQVNAINIHETKMLDSKKTDSHKIKTIQLQKENIKL